jgi:hypothetical protein
MGQGCTTPFDRITGNSDIWPPGTRSVSIVRVADSPDMCRLRNGRQYTWNAEEERRPDDTFLHAGCLAFSMFTAKFAFRHALPEFTAGTERSRKLTQLYRYFRPLSRASSAAALERTGPNRLSHRLWHPSRGRHIQPEPLVHAVACGAAPQRAASVPATTLSRPPKLAEYHWNHYAVQLRDGTTVVHA